MRWLHGISGTREVDIEKGLEPLGRRRSEGIKLGVANISMPAPGGSIGRSVKLAMGMMYREDCRGLCSGTHGSEKKGNKLAHS